MKDPIWYYHDKECENKRILRNIMEYKIKK